MSFRVTPEFKRRIDRAAARSGRSIAQEIELRLDQSLGGDAGFPPEIAALLELLGRAMLDTGTGISGINHSAGHGFKPWLADRYAYSQAVYAAIHVLQKSLPDGPAEPHGLFAGGAYTRERAEQFGRQVADGILEAMRGRHPDPGTAALWAPRVREKLGNIGDRLDQHPVPEEYIGPSTTAPAHFVMTRDAAGVEHYTIEPDEVLPEGQDE